MCLKHHSIFDGTNNQRKNYTLKVVRAARALLYAAIVKGQRAKSPTIEHGLIEETMVALDDPVRAGTVRYLGCFGYVGV